MTMLFFPVFAAVFLSFFVHRRHLLLSLLALEGIVLCLVISISLNVGFAACSFTLVIVFVLAVIEASIGLSVLVSMSRYAGKDMVSS